MPRTRSSTTRELPAPECCRTNRCSRTWLGRTVGAPCRGYYLRRCPACNNLALFVVSPEDVEQVLYVCSLNRIYREDANRLAERLVTVTKAHGFAYLQRFVADQAGHFTLAFIVHNDLAKFIEQELKACPTPTT